MNTSDPTATASAPPPGDAPVRVLEEEGDGFVPESVRGEEGRRRSPPPGDIPLAYPGLPLAYPGRPPRRKPPPSGTATHAPIAPHIMRVVLSVPVLAAVRAALSTRTSSSIAVVSLADDVRLAELAPVTIKHPSAGWRHARAGAVTPEVARALLDGDPVRAARLVPPPPPECVWCVALDANGAAYVLPLRALGPVDVVAPTPSAEEEGLEELEEDLQRADLAARWFTRSGMAAPTEAHQRAVAELRDVEAPGAGAPGPSSTSSATTIPSAAGWR